MAMEIVFAAKKELEKSSKFLDDVSIHFSLFNIEKRLGFINYVWREMSIIFL